MSNFNKVILLGRLTRDPELRYAPSGLAVCSFGFAVSNKTGQGGDVKEDTMFIDVVIFGKQAENSNQFLAKGRLALIEGRLQLRRWDSQDGQKRSKHEVVAQSITFMPRQTGGEQGGGFMQPDDHAVEAGHEPVNLNDDVPF